MAWGERWEKRASTGQSRAGIPKLYCCIYMYMYEYKCVYMYPYVSKMHPQCLAQRSMD
jgi:hypothetical protein